jgi:hypothetical protein
MEKFDTLEKAIDLFRSGDKAVAARLLAQQVTQDPKNDSAWLWLAASLEQTDQRIYCLHKAQALNPANPATLETLNSFLGLERPVREIGGPISLPPPAVPVDPNHTSESDADPVMQVKPAKKSLSRIQVIILLVLVVAIILIIAAMAYLILGSNPTVLPEPFRQIFGGGLILPPVF